MVKNSGTTARADQLRPLNPPVPVQVLTTEGLPVAVIEGDKTLSIERIDDRWQIEDEWWRDPVSRVYFRVVSDTGIILTLYHDEVGDHWYQQSY